MYNFVTSLPDISITLALPFNTSSGSLGVENPPSNSGHTAIALLSSISLRILLS